MTSDVCEGPAVRLEDGNVKTTLRACAHGHTHIRHVVSCETEGKLLQGPVEGSQSSHRETGPEEHGAT
jgi:hypothetical protein